MPIYRLIEREAFEPDHIEVITAAFEDVCRELGLADVKTPCARSWLKPSLNARNWANTTPFGCESALTTRSRNRASTPQSAGHPSQSAELALCTSFAKRLG